MKTIATMYTYKGPTQRGLEHNHAYPINLHFCTDQINVELRTAPYVVYTYEKLIQFIQHWDCIRAREES